MEVLVLPLGNKQIRNTSTSIIFVTRNSTKVIAGRNSEKVEADIQF